MISGMGHRVTSKTNAAVDHVKVAKARFQKISSIKGPEKKAPDVSGSTFKKGHVKGKFAKFNSSGGVKAPYQAEKAPEVNRGIKGNSSRVEEMANVLSGPVNQENAQILALVMKHMKA